MNCICCHLNFGPWFRYFMGQLYEIATVFYNLEQISVKILESKNDNPGSTTSPLSLDAKTVIVKYRLDFDNRDYVSINCFSFKFSGILDEEINLHYCNV